MSDWKRNRLSVEELLTKLENNLHQCRLTGHQAKTLLRLVRAADELAAAYKEHVDDDGDNLKNIWARLNRTYDNYRKLREGGGT